MSRSVPKCPDPLPNVQIHSQMSESVLKCPNPFLNVPYVWFCFFNVRIHSQMSGSVPTCLDPFPNVRNHYQMSGSVTYLMSGSIPICEGPFLYVWIHPICPDPFPNLQICSLKGLLTRDFRSLVFSHQTTPPRPLRHGLKPFSIWISIRRENRLCNRRFLSQRSQWLRCAAMQILKQIQQSHWHHDMHSGVNDSAVHVWYDMYDMQILNNFSGVIDSAVQIWHRCDFWRHHCEALANFKGNIYRKNIHRPIVLHYRIPVTLTQKWGLARDSFWW
jgi:hypothetical protein